MKSNSIIHLDMDGVITDFENRFVQYADGLNPEQYKEKFGSRGREKLYASFPLEFWTGMSWVDGGKELVEYALSNFNLVRLLTSTGTGNDWKRFKIIENGKLQWISKNIPKIEKKNVLFVPYANLKAVRHSAPDRLLVDDKDTTITGWNKRGGYGILHLSSNWRSTIQKLQEYLNQGN